MAKRKNIMKEFHLREISIVDKPAQASAKIVIAKRAVEKRMALTTLTAGHAHLIVGVRAHEDSLAELVAGKTSYSDNHQHDWVQDDAGNIIIADVEGHSHGLSVLVKVDNLTEEQLASLETVPLEASMSAEAIGTSGETTMSDPNDQTAESVVNEELETLKSQLATAERLAELNDADKAYLKGLSEDDKATFIALDADGRQSELAKAADADAVVFTSEDGTEYRKSDDSRLINLAKASDKEKKKRQMLEEEAMKVDLEKRAAELPLGKTAGVVSLVKAIDLLPTEEQGPALDLLKSHLGDLSKVTKSLGTTESSDDSVDPVDGIAKRLREADPSLTVEQAYSKALDTPEGQTAYNNRS